MVRRGNHLAQVPGRYFPIITGIIVAVALIATVHVAGREDADWANWIGVACAWFLVALIVREALRRRSTGSSK